MIIAAFIVVVGALLFIQYWSILAGQDQIKPSSPGITASNGSSPTILADSDWQKVLVGTGISMPGKSGPVSAGTTSTQSAPLTETAKLGQTIVSEYLQMQQSGQDISSSTVDEMVSNALNDPNIVTTAKVYSFSDLKIGKADTVAVALTYGQQVSQLFKNNNSVGNEATYARDSEEQNDPAIAAKIDPIIATYQTILNSLLSMSVPPSAAKVQLDLVNTMSERLTVAKQLRSINTDPAAGLQGAGQYLNALQDFSKAFLELKQYFAAIKIDPGTTSTTPLTPGSNQQ